MASTILSTVLGVATLPLAPFAAAKPSMEGVNLAKQAVRMPGNVFRNALSEHGLVEEFVPGVKTVYDLFEYACAKYGDKPLYGTRVGEEYQWISYKQFYARVKNVASGMIHAQISPRSHIGIYSKNRLEWLLFAEAANQQGMVVCALYDTLGPESSVYIAKHAELSALCFSKDMFQKVVNVAKHSSVLKVMIQYEPIDPEQYGYVPSHCRLFSLSEIESQGALQPVAPHPVPSEDDLVVLMYTSGTTGSEPKGCQFTSRNFMAIIGGAIRHVFPLGEHDVYLSYLPLAHILERAVEMALFGLGASIGFWSGDAKLVLHDVSALRPTLFAAVPRILDRIYDKINEEVHKSPLKKTVFDLLYGAKKNAMHRGFSTAPYDALLFNKIKAKFGGRIRQFLSGGAPLRAKVQEFISVAIAPVSIGYGLTETSAGGTISYPTDLHVGRIGPPIRSAEIKLLDIPEMGYLTTDAEPSGEVCIRGPTVTKGYYKAPQLTAEAWDNEGWFHTGDVGRYYPDSGTFAIIDRKKNIVKNALGEYIALEKVEAALATSRLVQSVWVYAEAEQAFIVCIVVANPETFKDKFPGMDVDAACRDPSVQSAVFDDLMAAAKGAKLLGFEIPKKMYLEPRAWSVDEGLITPTLKLVRPKLRKHYAVQIGQMYSEV
eukprot:ANDGO_00058.mRNA.1 Fatty acyl-CoA synthetase B